MTGVTQRHILHIMSDQITPVQAGWQQIDANRAAELLANSDLANRPINKRTVAMYLGDMQNGRWQVQASPPILLDRESNIIDGQHRLKALSKMPSWFTLNVEVRILDDSQIIQVVDTGRPRSLAATLATQGYSKTQAKHASALLSTSYRWIAGKPAGHVLSRQLQVKWLENNDQIEQASDFSYEFSNYKGLITAPIGVTATLFDISTFGVGTDLVQEFFYIYHTGASDEFSMFGRMARLVIDSKNPRTKARFTAERQGYAIARMFNAFIDGEDLTKTYSSRRALAELPGWGDWAEKRWDGYPMTGPSDT